MHCCGHAAPKALAWIGVVHAVGRIGGCHRRSPTGGDAYGMPRHDRPLSLATPSTGPSHVATVTSLSTTADAPASATTAVTNPSIACVNALHQHRDRNETQPRAKRKEEINIEARGSRVALKYRLNELICGEICAGWYQQNEWGRLWGADFVRFSKQFVVLERPREWCGTLCHLTARWRRQSVPTDSRVRLLWRDSPPSRLGLHRSAPAQPT